MPTKKVTIDNLPMQVHQDYARKTEEMEATSPLLLQALDVAKHPLIASLSRLYFSRWDELFGLVWGYTPRAHFHPPEKYFTAKSRLFSRDQLIDPLFAKEDAGNGEKEDTEEARAAPSDDLPSPLTALRKTVAYLNTLQQQINGKLLQYQKG